MQKLKIYEAGVTWWCLTVSLLIGSWQCNLVSMWIFYCSEPDFKMWLSFIVFGKSVVLFLIVLLNLFACGSQQKEMKSIQSLVLFSKFFKPQKQNRMGQLSGLLFTRKLVFRSSSLHNKGLLAKRFGSVSCKGVLTLIFINFIVCFVVVIATVVSQALSLKDDGQEMLTVQKILQLAQTLLY